MNKTEIIFRSYYTYLRSVKECKLETVLRNLSLSISYISQRKNNKREFDKEIEERLFGYFHFSLGQVKKHLPNIRSIL